VALEVPEDVADRVPDLGGRPEDVGVVAIGEDRAGAAHHPIQPERQADPKGPDPVRERALAVRLHDEVQVVALDAVVDDAAPGSALRAAEGRVDEAE
jgi:hypothetical protein